MTLKASRVLFALMFTSASAAAQTAPPPGYGTPGAPQQPYGAQQYPAQQQPYGAQQYPAQQPYGAQPAYAYPAYPQSPSERSRSGAEIAALYGVSVAYGVGMGIWIDAELGIKDPAIALITPAVLGIAAPIGVYVADAPMRRGLPGAIAAGAVIGAGEGLGLASMQFVRAKESDAWGFRGLSRATAIGATLGAAGGFALGYLQRPSPRSSVLLTSSVVWGSAIGSMFGYGASAKNAGYGRSNDQAALGGFIGYNVALVGAGALSMVHIPSTTSLEWMWLGAGIGFAASLPVYALYAGSDSPAKRGLLFSGTMTTLGLVAGGLFTARTTESAEARQPTFARLTTIAPLAAPGAVGLSAVGELF
ncbi:MAG: hypothetical protein ACOY0T_14315 [Myxococcota bacterium]